MSARGVHRSRSAIQWIHQPTTRRTDIMDTDDKKWFDTWIAAITSEHSVVEALGTDGTVTISYGNEFLVGATLERAIAYID